ncbi:uncharacterized protein BDW43DRAFT_316342 [Aspergillus alliaceus]|uniref:uncharacterized protein n=1 Tax=Petromyces alliaceus TaxID=209559 RepID=UPI0012A541BE|nr:uncharacterized protein BDW43DRAFT_316342 [Aspergillus alliaceus]KAB8227933.1 hypothetical protein BDW43DRAFT_316342 [Aspergillus alliaceus]
MSSEPKIATFPVTENLIITPQLRGAYDRASRPELRETATRPLFEELFNEYFRCPSLSVFGEQQLDDNPQAVDITVGYYDNLPQPNLVFVLLAETKRHKVESRGELESQLQEYGDRYLNQEFGGLDVNPTMYGATAYGTKIRFFEFSRANGVFKDRTFSGNLHVNKEEAYWDLKTDGLKIIPVMKEIWEFRKRLGQTTTAA